MNNTGKPFSNDLVLNNITLSRGLDKYEKTPKDSRNAITPGSKELLRSTVERRIKLMKKKSDKAAYDYSRNEEKQSTQEFNFRPPLLRN